MVKINNVINLDKKLRKHKKKQIILLNTNCSIENHLTKLDLRYQSRTLNPIFYDKTPTFTIDNVGNIYQHTNIDSCVNIFENDKYNNHAITIALENIGWVSHNESDNTYHDWIGNKYEGSIQKRPWRGKKNWANYFNEQIDVLSQLINYLCLEYSIKNEFIGHNVFVDQIYEFNGIFNRSNISANHYDLTPAFNFELLSEKLKNI